MAETLPMSVLVTLPIYLDGLDAGRDIGLAIALTAITAEQARLANEIVIAQTVQDPRSGTAAAYADGRLHEVAKRLAAVFRQPLR